MNHISADKGVIFIIFAPTSRKSMSVLDICKNIALWSVGSRVGRHCFNAYILQENSPKLLLNGKNKNSR